jgi:hypothetical protein
LTELAYILYESFKESLVLTDLVKRKLTSLRAKPPLFCSFAPVEDASLLALAELFGKDASGEQHAGVCPRGQPRARPQPVRLNVRGETGDALAPAELKLASL